MNDALGRSSDYFAGPFDPQEVHKGDLYDMLYPAGSGLETDQVYGGELTVEYDAPIRSAENLTIMTHGGGEGSLLMFRDSFGNNLYPYLADSFDAALFSRSMPYRLDLVSQREADYVVAELVERAFGVEAKNGLATLPGVMSRKKQMIPALLSAIKAERPQ